MTDSFASAHSFDPFQQQGSQGFKVPAVLPAGLIHSLASSNGSPWSSTDSQQEPSEQSFQDFVRRSSLQNGNHPHFGSNQNHPRSAQSVSGPSGSPAWPGWSSNSPGTMPPRPAAGGGGAYGQNRAWQAQQLEALQAERRRFMESRSPAPFQQQHQPSPSQQQQWQGPSSSGSLLARSPSVSSPAGSRQDHLSTLGLSFPSSHEFPAPSPPDGSGQPQPSISARLMDGDATMSESANNRGRSPTRRPPTHASNSASNGSKASTSKTANEASSKAEMDDDASAALYRPWPKAPSPSEPSETYPPLRLKSSSIDRRKVSDNTVAEAFFDRDPAEERRYFQPHLVDLKERRKQERARRAEAEEEKRRKKQAAMALSGGKGEDENKGKDSSPDIPDGDKGNKKPPHVLLTDAEKKANHIASEQKRRANIRKGYELLCAGVPALRDALDGEGEGENAGERDGEDEEGGGAANGSGVGGGGGADRVDGRAGPRSEAVVLGKSVEHLRYLLEVHRDLRSRRDHARAKWAQKCMGVDVVAGLAEELAQAEEEEAANAAAAVGKGGKKGKGRGGGTGGGGAKAPKGSKGSKGGVGGDAPSSKGTTGQQNDDNDEKAGVSQKQATSSSAGNKGAGSGETQSFQQQNTQGEGEAEATKKGTTNGDGGAQGSMDED